MSTKTDTSEIPANKPPVELTDKGEEVTPQDATPEEVTPKEAIPKEANSKENASKDAGEGAFEEAVRLLCDVPNTAPSTPQPSRTLQEELLKNPPCDLEGTQNGVVLIESDEETPQKPDVVDDTSSPKHKIAKLEDPNK